MPRPGFDQQKRRNSLRQWLSAIDPGYLRLVSAGRAALALLSIWWIIRVAVRLQIVGSQAPVALLGVLSGLVFLLFIIDLKPSDRKISLLLAPIPFTGAVILASFLSENFWLNNLILLLLFFFSYFFRRFGARAGELALVTTVGFYLGFLLHISQALYWTFLAIVGVSVLVVYLWQFVLIPYDPVQSLLRSVTAFYRNVALTLATAQQGFESAQSNIQFSKKLERQYKQVHQNRRVIEGLFTAAVLPSIWSTHRLNRLQEEMFKTERGLELLIEAVIELTPQRSEMPEEVLKIITDGLVKIEDELWNVASGKDQAQLSDAGDRFQSRVKFALEKELPGGRLRHLLRIGIAARQLTQSVAQIQAIKNTWNESQIDESQAISPARVQPPMIKLLNKKSGLSLHPTTILGLQAVLATGLAMLAAYLLDFDQPNLVYWTAFVVIAGSTGESLRRIIFRIIGVISGTVIGVALGVVLPNNPSLIVLLVTLCIFMTIYSITLSYIRMVFWLNIAMLLVITSLGGSARELIVLRPVSTFLGASIAALVVVFVLPIHVQNRFANALTEFLKVIDRYIESYLSTLMGTPLASDLTTEAVKIDTSYKRLELNLPNVAYEYNPMSRAQSRFTSQATSLAVLNGYVTHLEADVGGEPGILADFKQDELIRTIQAHLHTNVEVLTNSLAQGQSESNSILADLRRHAIPEVTLEELLTTETGSVEAARNRTVFHLARINDTIFQIASNLGAPNG